MSQDFCEAHLHVEFNFKDTRVLQKPGFAQMLKKIVNQLDAELVRLLQNELLDSERKSESGKNKDARC